MTVNRKPYYINTGVRVKKGRLVANAVRDDEESMNADILNERLTTIVTLVEKEVNKCLEEQRPIDVADIRRKLEQRKHYTEMLSALKQEQKAIQKILEEFV